MDAKQTAEFSWRRAGAPKHREPCVLVLWPGCCHVRRACPGHPGLACSLLSQPVNRRSRSRCESDCNRAWKRSEPGSPSRSSSCSRYLSRGADVTRKGVGWAAELCSGKDFRAREGGLATSKPRGRTDDQFYYEIVDSSRLTSSQGMDEHRV
jgi:hypothetical protein